VHSPRRGGPEAGTLVDLLRERADQTPEAPSVTFLLDGEKQEEAFTYADLDRHARRIAVLLLGSGIRSGDRALLLYPPGLEYLTTYFGCLYAGVIAVPAYPPVLNRPSSQLRSFIANAKPAAALTIAGIAESREPLVEQEPALGTVRWLVTDAADAGLEDGWTRPDLNSETIAFLQYSSGSTTTPKGVIISHANLLVNTRAMCERANLGPESRTVSWLPPYHDAGLIGKVLTPLVGGFQTVLMSPVAFLQRPARWLEAIDHHRATCSAAPNFAFDLCVRKTTPQQRERLDLSSWICAMNTGEPVRAQTLERFSRAFAPSGFRLESFYPCYGLAESTVMVGGPDSNLPPRFARLHRAALQAGDVVDADGAEDGAQVHELVACGYRLPCHRVEIVDPDTREVLGERQIGEIWVNGPSVARGYWDNREATEQTFHAHLADGDSTEFMRTGDLGFLSDGQIHVAGRLKDVILVRGRNHYPQDIECTVEHVDAALRPGCGAAFAVEQDGEEALVVVNEVDRARLGEAEAVLTAVSDAILREHGLQLHSIVLIEKGSLPKTSSGKQQRRATRERLLQGALPVVAEWNASAADPVAGGERVTTSVERPSRTAIESWLVRRLARETERSPERISRDMPFAQLGVDSVAAVALTAELSEWLGAKVEDTAPWDHPTIARLASHLAGEAPAPVGGRRAAPEAEPIAIVGMSCRFPGAPDIDTFRTLLREGRDTTSDVPPERWDAEALYDPEPATPGKIVSRRGGFVRGVDRFDAAFFGIAPAEAAYVDPQQRLLLEVTWEALEHAGQSPAELAGTTSGVFVGIGTADYFHLQAEAGALTAYSATGTAHSVAANRLSYALDLRGPSVAVDTACSSSLVALHLACQSLGAGETDVAIAGGVNLILAPHLSIALSQARMLAPDGRCKAFDASADGYGRGEGCGIVVLKRLSDAVRDGQRVLSLVRGSAVRQDGQTSGLSAPNGPAQQAVIRGALEAAGVTPDRLTYVEAHGTGTPLGDPVETQALAAVLGEGASEGERVCRIGSVKANIGHLEAAAGIAGVIKTVLALSEGERFPQPNFEQLNPRIALDGTRLRVATDWAPWQAGDGSGQLIAGVSSFGFGGTLAHAILEAPPEPTPREPSDERPVHVATLSAHTDTALRELARRVAARLSGAHVPPLPDVAHTLNTGRARLPRRLAVRARTVGDLRGALEGFAAGNPGTVVRPAEGAATRPAVGFLFSGQGAQHPGMTRTLFETSPTYRRALERCAEIADLELGQPLLDLLFAEDGSERLHQTGVAQPALVATEIALTELWRSWGVAPDAVLGHSVGELAAAHVAGVLTLEDAMTLAAVRGTLMQSLPPGGAMAAALATAEAVRTVIDPGQAVDIAAINGTEAVTISGAADAVERASARLEGGGARVTPLRVSHAFHSRLVEPILGQLENAASELAPSAPRIPIVWGLTGELADEAPDGSFWRRQAREPVRFADAVETLDRVLAAAGPAAPRILLEVGPRTTLLGLVRRQLDPADRSFIGSLAGEGGDWEPLLEAVTRMDALGVPVDWRGFDRDYRRSRVPLPTYPFERRRHWFADGRPAGPAAPESSAEPEAPPIGPAPAPSRDQLLALERSERMRRLEEYLAGEVARVLGVPPATLSAHDPLRDAGLDSLMALDVRNRIEAALQVPLPVVSLAEGAAIADLAEGLDELIVHAKDAVQIGVEG
jgi:acyl transferase domain-containing protein/acyl-CoA synthetase (AMP-forming)/AMP-acid ligase II